MADVLRARGPDDHGSWVDAKAGIALGHRRLSVRDLSALGHQPMQSCNGRMVISYNGELYNSAELRTELEQGGSRFRGHSDTEIVVEACAAWGVDTAVRRLSGMFAFALWDGREQSLYLARDRVGIKPLYWGRQGTTFFFGSQLKAFRPHPDWHPEIDRDAVATYIRFGYVPSPYAIYEGMAKLNPGNILRIDHTGAPKVTCYWDIREIASQEPDTRGEVSDDEATDVLERLLRNSIERHMISDVPTGAFLSGGIDSSMVAALMQLESPQPIKTFSIGLAEKAYDEAIHARSVAHHIGSNHTELYITPREAAEVIPHLPDWFDEPFADSSQIPTFLISQLARKDVTVALSGDGGDELFAGYNRYVWCERLKQCLMWLPAPARQGLAGVINGVPSTSWDAIFAAVPKSYRPAQAGGKMQKLAGLLALPDREGLYRHLVSQWQHPEQLLRGGVERSTAMDEVAISRRATDFLSWMQLMDMCGYLPDDILTKLDRASMAVSLEARVPLLDQQVLEFAWSLPRKMKIRNGDSKWLLRRVLYRHVPQVLVDRPKMGFGIPIGDWLRVELRDWAEELLNENRLEQGGIFKAAPIRRIWDEHVRERNNWQYPLWVILMFQAWRTSWTESPAAA
jgi:asparagine synthase (glutamine-hydrolysing)